MAKRQSVTQRYREALEEIAGAILPVKPVTEQRNGVEITEMLVPLKNAEYLRTVAREALEKKS